jgi:hypothetical protein
MLSTQHAKPFHLFYDTFSFSTLKDMLCIFVHICDREAGKKSRREWINREHGHGQVDLN